MDHLGRRALLKGAMATGAGLALPNFGGLFHTARAASDATKKGKACILLWMNGGASQIDTFDLKPGQRNGGPFRPIATDVAGTQVCEYLPEMAKRMGRLAVIRSMKTGSPDHPDGIYHMHTCYRMSERIPHPEIGAMVAKHLGDAGADLPSFVRMGPVGNAGAGYLGPKWEPFSIGRKGEMPSHTAAISPAKVEERRAALWRFVEEEFGKESKADPFAAHREAKERAWRLMRARPAFDLSKEWAKDKDRYGDTDFGRGCRMALKLVEAGVPFVEVGQDNYDSHADNFVCHKANLRVLDPAWSALLDDLKDRGLRDRVMVVWMGEVGRTPQINNRAGRDHYIDGWTVCLSGGGIKGGATVGATNADGRGVKDRPTSEGDLFATIYTALGINPRARHLAGVRPIWATPEGSKAVKELL
ncbi:MAG: DUF1501 domain-containing protein [Gemmataceae bacterium]|nr:DUF1501 domain-containing protein [Gemmataceae bacterium]